MAKANIQITITMMKSFNGVLLLATFGVSLAGAIDPIAEVRHNANTRPLELNVDARATYNDKFMALMESPCRPEADGFFGATSGEPVQITYGFKLEAQPLSSIMDLLDVVEDKIVDGLLSAAFPQICGFRRRRLTHHAAGFRFMSFQEVEKCTPSGSPVDFCGIFTGQVNVYGRDQTQSTLQVLNSIDEILNPSDPTMLHSELVGMSAANDYLEVTGVDLQLESENNQDALLWGTLALVLLLFFSSVWWFYLRNDKEGDTAYSSNSQRTNKRRNQWTRFFKRKQYQLEYNDYNPEERSIKPSYEPEAAAFGGGDSLLLADGQPIQFEMDSNYQDDPSATGHII